jgi:hypothetical protein
MKALLAIVPAVVLAATTPILGAPVTLISGTANAGGLLLRTCGVGLFSSKKIVTTKKANASDSDRHNGACWQYRRFAGTGRLKRTYVCY